MPLGLALSTKHPQGQADATFRVCIFFSLSCGSCDLDVDRGRSVTAEQAFSGTSSSGKYSIFSNFCSEEEKKKILSRVKS